MLIIENFDLAHLIITADFIKQFLTDDDIEVVQQWAIWYFTNGSNTSNEFYRSVYAGTTLPSVKITNALGNTQDLSTIRQQYAGILYQYLINTAVANSSENVNITYPTIDKTIAISMDVEGDYYKVGPFKINSGNTIPTDFVANITTDGGDLNDVDYIVTEDGTDVTDTFTSMDFDKIYYFYLPIVNNTISTMTLTISYTPIAQRKITLWTGVDDTENLQPVVLLTNKASDEVTDSITATREEEYDLALRKFIVSVNGVATSGRTPVPTRRKFR